VVVYEFVVVALNELGEPHKKGTLAKAHLNLTRKKHTKNVLYSILSIDC
jgi:hypothetical protein